MRSISPALVATRRKVIKESLKDGLRAWVEGRAVVAQKRKADEVDATEKINVKSLVRRYTARRAAAERQSATLDAAALRERKKKPQPRWGREADMARKKEREERRRGNGACSQPTRANVLGMKRFWEGVIRAAAG